MYAFNLFCIAVILYAAGRNRKVREIFSRQNLFVRMLVLDACVALLLGIPAGFEESAFLLAALEGTTAWFLHGLIMISSVGGGFYVGSKVYDLFKRRSEYTGIFFAVCLGFAVFFCAGIALRYVFVKLPGVGWRLDRQMLSTGMGSNTSFKADGYAAA